MIAFPLKRYRYTFYFSGFQWECLSTCTPENMHHDFNEGEVISLDYGNQSYLIDFSKVCLIKCHEEVDFKDLPDEKPVESKSKPADDHRNYTWKNDNA